MFGISRNIILVMVVLVLCGSTFLGYFVGWDKGYDDGSKAVMHFYKQNMVDKNNRSKELVYD